MPSVWICVCAHGQNCRFYHSALLSVGFEGQMLMKSAPNSLIVSRQRGITKKLPSCVKARLDGFMLQSVMHQHHTPTPPESISVTLPSLLFLHNLILRAYFFKKYGVVPWAQIPPIWKTKLEHFIQEQIAPMYTNTWRTLTRARAVVLFFSAPLYLRPSGCCEWTVLLTLKDYRWKKKSKYVYLHRSCIIAQVT